MPNGDIDGVDTCLILFLVYCLRPVVIAGDLWWGGVAMSIVGCVPNGNIHGVDRFVCDGVFVAL